MGLLITNQTNDILKEINYWMSLFEQCNSRFNKLMDKKSTQCTENYWKQRCEWSELCITRLETVLPFNTVYDSLKTYDCYAQWQQLKSKTSPTGDRDCEELKKELGDIKAVYSKLVKTASAENLNKLQSRISELEEENNKLIMLTKQLLNKHPLVKTIRWKQ